jgi:aminopeptidase N
LALNITILNHYPLRISHHSVKYFLAFILLSAVLFSCKTPKAGFDDKNAIVLDTMQITVPRENPYRAAATIVHDLVHTKLEVNFDWQHQWMYGKAWVTVKPHFYTQDSLILEAKYMDIYKVTMMMPDGSMTPLDFSYDTMKIHIKLNKPYEKDEKYTVFIDYKAKPNDHKSAGSNAIQDDKGLYFINPLGTDSDKPKEIWTQGETESNSNWFPTFDKPNFKCTEEIYITVDKKYTTLSNGVLVSQKENGNGTRTDYWKMDLPHSTYLFMMCIGDFIITKDHWKDIPVNYYLEPKFAPYSRQIFGETPAMIEFFSERLGVPYVWPKYSQVVARDYVSGAMENTTATLHGENLNMTPRKMLDEDYHDYISHELFHQWFGDLVTCESWSNITLNESFADYGEYLWNEHRYGKEYGDWKNHQALEKYMAESKRGKNVNFVRYHYDDREEVFDTHTYEKGGRILHMLRYAVGDDAFFKSLQLYLKTYEFKNTEVAQLREIFEKVTGRDMNWFFNQWYFNNGHPILNFDYSYAHDSVYVKVSQKHNTDVYLTYELPFVIGIHYGKNVERHEVVLKKKSQTFVFKANGKPDLIDGDAERILLCEKMENKTTEEYVFQYRNAANYMQKREAIDSLRRQQRLNYDAMMVYRDALKDKSESIRAIAARYISMTANNKDTVLPLLKTALQSDSASHVRAAVIEALGKQKAKEYVPIIEKYLGDSSYLVASTALSTLNKLDSAEALQKAKLFDKETVFDIKNAVYTVNSTSGDSSYDSYFVHKLHEEKGFSRSFLLYHYANFLLRMSPEMAMKGIDTMKNILLDMKDQNSQMHSFGTGSIQRIKDSYERDKGADEGILNSDKKTKAKYDLNKVKADIATAQTVIAHAKAALDAVKK